MKKTTLDLTGQIFGELKVLSFSHYYKKQTLWNCRCSCGNEIEVNQKVLFSGEMVHCGCKEISEYINLVEKSSESTLNNRKTVKGIYFDNRYGEWNVSITYNRTLYIIGSYKNFEYARRARVKAEEIIHNIKKKELENSLQLPRPVKKPTRNLVGQKFGKLTVVSLHEIDRYVTWHCKCECGNEKNVLQHNLITGKVISCGCERKRVAKEYSENYLHIYKGIQIEKSMAKTTPKNNTSGFRGVIQDKRSGRYRARMILQGVRYELGWYDDFEEAKKARLVAEARRDAIVEEYLSLNK